MRGPRARSRGTAHASSIVTSQPTAGRVEMDTAVQFATSPHDFKLLVAAEGKRGTTMDDLNDAETRRAPMAA